MTTPDQISFRLRNLDYHGRSTTIIGQKGDDGLIWTIKTSAAHQRDDDKSISGLTPEQLMEIGAIATAVLTGVMKP